jgi:hypothetical protein
MHRDERRASTSKRSRETEAEAVAFVVCQAIGLEIGSAAQGYIQLYEGDAKLLSDSLEYIQRTATRILNAIGAEILAAISPVDCIRRFLIADPFKDPSSICEPRATPHHVSSQDQTPRSRHQVR